MAAPVDTLIHTPTPTTGSTSIDIDFSTGSPSWSTDDIMVAVVTQRADEAVTCTGWTEAAEIGTVTGASRITLLYKYFVSGDSKAHTFSWTSSVYASAFGYRVTGGPTSGNPFVGLQSATSASNSPEFDCPDGGAGLSSGALTESDNWLFMFGASAGAQTTYTGADISTANGPVGSTSQTEESEESTQASGSPDIRSHLVAHRRGRTGSTASFTCETRGSTGRDHSIIIGAIGAAAGGAVDQEPALVGGKLTNSLLMQHLVR